MSNSEKLLATLQMRFEQNMPRHSGMSWEKVAEKLTANIAALESLEQMEESGGEPDVIGYEDGKYIFCDCAAESPKGRRSLCYDDAALESRKEHKPQGSAVGMAKHMGIELLDEAWYTKLQELGDFDTKTSSWVATPSAVRKLGGALFGDKRYERVFFYHNGAESYYAARGFRGMVRV